MGLVYVCLCTFIPPITSTFELAWFHLFSHSVCVCFVPCFCVCLCFVCVCVWGVCVLCSTIPLLPSLTPILTSFYHPPPHYLTPIFPYFFILLLPITPYSFIVLPPSTGYFYVVPTPNTLRQLQRFTPSTTLLLHPLTHYPPTFTSFPPFITILLLHRNATNNPCSYVVRFAPPPLPTLKYPPHLHNFPSLPTPHHPLLLDR